MILARVRQKAACYIVTGPENRQLIEDMPHALFPA
jgi:hypothetical protein